jgi:hypothetical protein
MDVLPGVASLTMKLEVARVRAAKEKATFPGGLVLIKSSIFLK